MQFCRSSVSFCPGSPINVKRSHVVKGRCLDIDGVVDQRGVYQWHGRRKLDNAPAADATTESAIKQRHH